MYTHPNPLHFPGTIHYINPLHTAQDEDSVLISEFGRKVRWAGIALCIYTLIVAVNLISCGIHDLGYDSVQRFVGSTNSPFLLVLLGMLLTFTVQSSTVFTTLTVATVGAGIVPMDMAVMLIMGSNVGTCATSQMVAFGFYRTPDNLNRALSAAMTHWWFNVLSVALLFPIELLFQPLTRGSAWLSNALYREESSGFDFDGIVHHLVSPVTDGISSLLHRASNSVAGTISIAIGVVAIVLTVHAISRLMRELTAAGSHHMLEDSADRQQAFTPVRFVLAGLGLTMMSQSSSATICSTLPFAGTGHLSLRKVLGIVLGANLGTTLTAVLAALAVPGEFGQLALQAALIHVLLNLIGLLFVLVIRPVSRVIYWLSEASANAVRGYPLQAFIVMMASYTVLPLAVLLFAAAWQ